MIFVQAIGGMDLDESMAWYDLYVDEILYAPC
jgi:hypothetical protein